MNSFINHNKQVFSLLLGLLLNSSLHAITFQNQPLSNFIQPGEILIVTVAEKDNLVMWDIKNDNIDIKLLHFPFRSPKDMLEKVLEKHSCNPIKLKSSDIIPNKHISTNSHIIGECITLESKKSINFKDCLLEAPHISITGNKIAFKDSFLINPQILSLSTNSQKSSYQTIQILFHDQTNIPTFISGLIDFECPWRFFENPLGLTNVKEIRIEFNPQIWND